MSLFQQRQMAANLALMSPEQRAAYQGQIAQQGRQSGALRLGAGLFDFFGGKKAQEEGRYLSVDAATINGRASPSIHQASAVSIQKVLNASYQSN